MPLQGHSSRGIRVAQEQSPLQVLCAWRRTVFMPPLAALTAVSCAVTAVAGRAALQPSSLLAGFAFGCHWSLMPVRADLHAAPCTTSEGFCFSTLHQFMGPRNSLQISTDSWLHTLTACGAFLLVSVPPSMPCEAICFLWISSNKHTSAFRQPTPGC